MREKEIHLPWCIITLSCEAPIQDPYSKRPPAAAVAALSLRRYLGSPNLYFDLFFFFCFCYWEERGNTDLPKLSRERFNALDSEADLLKIMSRNASYIILISWNRWDWRKKKLLFFFFNWRFRKNMNFRILIRMIKTAAKL